MRIPRNARKIWFLAPAVPVLLLLGLGARRMRSQAPPAAPSAQDPDAAGVRGTGTLESVQEVPLAFKVGGRILDLPLDEGSPIARGQLLGRLDPGDLKAQLTVARAARSVAVAGTLKAKADLDLARAAQLRAADDFRRAQRLHREGVLSRADLDAAQEKRSATEAAVQAMDAMGHQAEGNVTLAGGTEAIQQLNLAESRLLSPVDGILTRRLREPGNVVTAGTPVLTVVSTRKLWVRAWVDESALGRLKVGQGARVALRSHPGQVFMGRVDRISRQSDRQTHELLVDVEVLDLPPLFAVGQRADVEIRTSGMKEGA